MKEKKKVRLLTGQGRSGEYIPTPFPAIYNHPNFIVSWSILSTSTRFPRGPHQYYRNYQVSIIINQSVAKNKIKFNHKTNKYLRYYCESCDKQ
jgi:hypothetical protein